MLQKVFDYFMNCMMTNKWDRGFKGCPKLIKDNPHSGKLQPQLMMIPLNEFEFMTNSAESGR
jgi:hypothetical protein